MVLIARALCAEPSIMILDEPESNLDYKNQQNILRILKRLASESSISILFNTHYPEHALRLADQTLLIHRGQTTVGAERRAAERRKFITALLDPDRGS